MKQYPIHSSPFVFSDGRKKTSSSTSKPRSPFDSPSSKSKYLDPNSFVTRKLSVDAEPFKSLSPFSSPPFPSASLSQPLPPPSRPSSTDDARSTISFHIDDILSPGDIVSEGTPLHGEVLRLVPNQFPERARVTDYEDPAREFEVVRKLGTGSYTVVYLVREVLSRSSLPRLPSEDDRVYPGGRLELDDAAPIRPPTEYGREYAIKLLSKAKLDEDEFVVQLTEAAIHQSLPVHPNIVTLHRTLETSAWFLLVLEFVPGQDLFYFLEQARDHYDVDPTEDPAFTHTPPTPGLLSSLHPSQLLSPTRLRLIASMFAQMCEAVATCHDASVFHRDIKPDNFIVTDGLIFNQDGIRERKVVVKLSDFGLSTRDAVSSDMDCGSAPYMSYECRNDVAPVYKPRAADVWSLGIVLINMIYHCNPWVVAVKDGCSSFDQYLSNQTDFFMRRFAGMTLPVANFLVENVFCILDDPTDDSQRIGAHEFGVWVRDLPALVGASQPVAHTHSRAPSPALIATGQALTFAPASRRPSSRQASVSPRDLIFSFVTRDASQALVLGHDGSEGAALPVLGIVLDEDEDDEQQHESKFGRSPSPLGRSTSNTMRRKRGSRKKGTAPSFDPTQTSELLASASQTLARKLSRQARSASTSAQSFSDIPPPPPVPMPTSMPTITKKPSRWKLSFGKSAGEASLSSRSDSRSVSNSGSGRTANVLDLIMGLDPPPISSQPQSPEPPLSPPSLAETAGQGRGGQQQQQGPAASPTRLYSGRAVANVSAAPTSSNWRNSVASASTSLSTFSTFTRYSDQSMHSVSRFAAAVSTCSASSSSDNWRTAPSSCGH